MCTILVSGRISETLFSIETELGSFHLHTLLSEHAAVLKNVADKPWCKIFGDGRYNSEQQRA
jgi:hypothetical protein